MTTNKTETVIIKCRRCGGAGAREEWRNTGSTCFDCGGAGTEEVTPEVLEIHEADRLNVELSAIGYFMEYAIEGCYYAGRVPVAGQEANVERIAVRLHDLDDSDAARKFLRRVWNWDFSGCHGGTKADWLKASREAVRLVIAAGKVTEASEAKGAWRTYGD